jgi:hypothetical protein
MIIIDGFIKLFVLITILAQVTNYINSSSNNKKLVKLKDILFWEPYKRVGCQYCLCLEWIVCYKNKMDTLLGGGD